jgi:Na+/melibiose symporter-like transporter
MAKSAAANVAPAPLPSWKPPLWATGQLAVQIYRDMPSMLLLFYMTQILVVPPIMAGIAIFLPKLLWSTGCDYMVGAWLDKRRGRMSRRVLLLIGAALLPVTMMAVFTPFPSDSALVRSIYVTLCMTGYMTIFSVFSVPHLSIGAELAEDARGQSVVMGWRTISIGAGILIGGGGGPWIVQHYGGTAHGYFMMALTMSFVCSVSLIVAYFGSHETDLAPAAQAPGGKWHALRQNREFLYALGAFFALMVGQGAAYATFTYLAVFRLALPQPFEAMGISTVACGLATVAAQVVLIRATAHFGALRVFLFGSVFYSASLAALAYGPVGSLAAFYMSATALGLSNATILQSAYTRLSELIREDAARNNGQSNAGFYSSLFVATDKVAFGLGGTLLAGALLSFVGFQSGSSVQSAEATIGIGRIYAFTPMLFSLLAIVLMYRSSATRPARMPTPVLLQAEA